FSLSLNLQMKRKLDHGPDGRPFSSGKKHCKGSGYLSPSSLVQATPTTFGDLRLANGHSAQRRRVTSGPPPSGLQDWLHTFQTWSGPERLLALDELIDRCETSQVKHMMQVIEPQFQRDFISLLPKELALYVLTFLAPRDLLQAAQTCRYWRILAEDNLLWREKCREEGISECTSLHRRKCAKPGAAVSPWKSAYIRQHCIENNWRKGDSREPMVLKGHDDHVITCLQFSGDLIVSGSDDNTLKVWSAITGKCLRTLTGHTGGVWCSEMTASTVISGSTDRTLRVWDTVSGECVHTLYGHTSTVRCMHLHGNRVVSGSRDTTLRVWDVSSGRCEHVLTGHVAAVRCVQYDGRRVVSGGYDYMVKVWDPETEVCLHTLQGHTNRVYSLQIWDLTGHLVMMLFVSGPNKHQSAVTCLQFCRGLVLSSSDDGTVKLWDLKTGAWLRDVVALQSRGSGGVVWRIRASDTRLVCAAGSRNGTEETKLLVLDFDLDDKKNEMD
uniref:F-box domain-containing protein n=1 Tax=Anabas testudineus TaxID=64144 RepID=A0A7N6AE00_ANATE